MMPNYDEFQDDPIARRRYLDAVAAQRHYYDADLRDVMRFPRSVRPTISEMEFSPEIYENEEMIRRTPTLSPRVLAEMERERILSRPRAYPPYAYSPWDLGVGDDIHGSTRFTPRSWMRPRRGMHLTEAALSEQLIDRLRDLVFDVMNAAEYNRVSRPRLTQRGRGPKGYRRADERIHEDVCELLTRDRRLDPTEVTVRVSNGEVTLEGEVNTRMDKRISEYLAESVSGVEDVHNSLRVRHRGDYEAEVLGFDEEKSASKPNGRRRA